MRIAACVVLYNPENDCIENVNSYYSLVDKLYVLDNSTKYNELLIDYIKSLPNAEYINLDGNKGIAHALKSGVGKATEESYDLCLTMDQDSKFPELTRAEIEERFIAIDNLQEYGIIGLNMNSTIEPKKLIVVQTWITSGNFIILENYKAIHGFKEELFIDFVDFDINEQFAQIGKKVAYWQDLSLEHKIGNPRSYNILGIKFTVMNHSPIRYYYRFRNALYLYKRDKKFYKKLYWHGLLIDIPKIILFEKKKLLKLKMIRKGRKDARGGRLGEYSA
ncbi:MAG: glycosyltransferase [Bacilli bacterium]|nr:glycosyltransferase [Bacilli bacterium]